MNYPVKDAAAVITAAVCLFVVICIISVVLFGGRK